MTPQTLTIRSADEALFVAAALNRHAQLTTGRYTTRQRRGAERLVNEAYAVAHTLVHADDRAARAVNPALPEVAS